MPTLSVILPNHNHAATLPRALDALLGQSRPAEQIVVVDDGSTDNSVEIIQRYAAQHAALQFVQHEQNRGVLAAMHTALNHATGQYIYGAAADDQVQPWFFNAAMTQAQEHPHAATLFGDVLACYSDPRGQERQTLPGLTAPTHLTPAQYLDLLNQQEAGFSLCAATLYRRNALDEVGGFRDELGSWADTFAARAMSLQHGAVYLGGPEPAVAWTARPDSFSHRESNDARMQEIGHRAAALMRSKTLSDLFPESHIRRWETRWMLEMAGGYAHISDTLLPRKLRDVRRTYAQLGREGRWLDRVLSAALRRAFGRLDRQRRERDHG